MGGLFWWCWGLFGVFFWRGLVFEVGLMPNIYYFKHSWSSFATKHLSTGTTLPSFLCAWTLTWVCSSNLPAGLWLEDRYLQTGFQDNEDYKDTLTFISKSSFNTKHQGKMLFPEGKKNLNRYPIPCLSVFLHPKGKIWKNNHMNNLESISTVRG